MRDGAPHGEPIPQGTERERGYDEMEHQDHRGQPNTQQDHCTSGRTTERHPGSRGLSCQAEQGQA